MLHTEGDQPVGENKFVAVWLTKEDKTLLVYVLPFKYQNFSLPTPTPLLKQG